MLRADSCRAATWDDLQRKAGRGGRTTVDDRRKPSRAKSDERRSVQTFEAQAPATRCSRRRTRALETTPSTRAARGGEGSEWCWVQPNHTQPHAAREEACEREHVGQHVDSDAERPWSAMGSDSWSAMKIASGSWSAMTTAREQRKPLTNQGTTLQKTVCTALAGRD